jgi:S-methylmethionine-dependent homocysteine/selenocysteine methylase
MNILEFYSQINRPLVLDGAVGSLLQQRGVVIHKTLWSSYANIVAPEKVIELHREYINAGADIISTNTFRTNPSLVKNVSLNISNSEFVKQSVELAFEAKSGTNNIFIAGSNPPAEDSYQPFRKISKQEIELNHKNHIDMLWDNKVDFILNETQSHFDEVQIICEHCDKNEIPFVISLFVTAEGKIMSGESLNDVIKFIKKFNPLAIGINCIMPIDFENVIATVDTLTRWGFYLNCGSGNYTDTKIFEGITPTDYIYTINRNYKQTPFFIGSCCGSSPLHTKAIKDFVLGKYKSKSCS